MKLFQLSGIVRLFILFVFLVATLSGCAFFDPKRETASTAPQPEQAAAVMLPSNAPTRELGSLWSDNSKWNDFYSIPSGRTVGDLVILRPSENFKATITKEMGKGAQVDAGAYENARIVATVKEVLPRQVYRVEAHQPLRLGKSEVTVHYRGKIRDQDLGADDSGTTDAIFESQMQVDLKHIEPATTVATAEKSAEAKEASEKESEKKQ